MLRSPLQPIWDLTIHPSWGPSVLAGTLPDVLSDTICDNPSLQILSSLDFPFWTSLQSFKTRLPGRGFHTLIRNVLFSSPTEVGSHILSMCFCAKLAVTTLNIFEIQQCFPRVVRERLIQTLRRNPFKWKVKIYWIDIFRSLWGKLDAKDVEQVKIVAWTPTLWMSLFGKGWLA